MTIPWTTNPGGLYTRLGVLGGMISDLLNFANTNVPTDITAIEAQYDAAFLLIDGLSSQQSSEQSSIATIIPFLQNIGVNTANYMVWQDNPLLSNSDLFSSLLEIIRQMKATSQTVKKCNVAVGSITANGGNIGNGICCATTYRADGLEQENLYAEQITLTCTQDENDNSSLAGNEGFTVSGQVAVSTFDPSWPQGSGQSTSLSVIDAAVDGGSGNILTGGSFESWTGSVPTGWTVAAGGTKIQKSTSQHYIGSASCQFIGDGSTLQSITQAVNVSYLSQYAVNLWIMCDTVAAQTGVLQVDLVDANGTIIDDYSGNPNSFTKTLSGLTAGTWTPINGFFRLPQVMPTSVSLRIHMTTALSNSTNLYLDMCGMGGATPMYASGPSFAIFAGVNNFYDGDYFTVQVTNDRAGSSLNKTFQTLCNRLWSLDQLGLLLPSSASPTISDTLITT